MEGLAIKGDIISRQFSVAYTASWLPLTGAAAANGSAVLIDEAAPKLLSTITACEAVLVEMLAHGGRHSVVHVFTAIGAHPMLRAILVEGLAVLKDVLASDTPTASGTRKEVTSTRLAMRLTIVLVERTGQLISTTMATEVIQVEVLSLGHYVVVLYLLSTLVAGSTRIALGPTMTYGSVSLVILHVSRGWLRGFGWFMVDLSGLMDNRSRFVKSRCRWRWCRFGFLIEDLLGCFFTVVYRFRFIGRFIGRLNGSCWGTG